MLGRAVLEFQILAQPRFVVFDPVADAGYQGVAKREEVKDIKANWHVAMRPGKRRALDKSSPMGGAALVQLEHLKARIRAKVEHPFRVIKRQFGYIKVKYRGLAKNTPT